MGVIRHEVPAGVLFEGRAEEAYAEVAPGSVALAWVDGPYALDPEKGDWDRLRVRDLVDFYRPHVEALGRLCAPSASVYHWGTAEGEGYVRDLYRDQGFEFRSLVVWDKGHNRVMRSAPEDVRTWPDVTEVAGFYQRCQLRVGAWTTMAHAAGASENNLIRPWLRAEWLERGLTSKEADRVLGKNGMAGHYFGASQWELPTLEAFSKLAAYAQAKLGNHPDGRPAFVHPDAWAATREGGDGDSLERGHAQLREVREGLLAQFDHVRQTYAALRVPFTHQRGVTNVWRMTAAPAADRLGHPCHKPLIFVERAVLASTRPGDVVLDPFAGSGGVARVCAGLPAGAERSHVSVEMDPAYCQKIVEAARAVVPRMH